MALLEVNISSSKSNQGYRELLGISLSLNFQKEMPVILVTSNFLFLQNLMCHVFSYSAVQATQGIDNLIGLILSFAGACGSSEIMWSSDVTLRGTLAMHHLGRVQLRRHLLAPGRLISACCEPPAGDCRQFLERTCHVWRRGKVMRQTDVNSVIIISINLAVLRLGQILVVGLGLGLGYG